MENDDEKQYVNNCGPIVNASDSEGLYVPMAQNEKTKMENDDEKQYVNNCGPIVNASDSEGLYVPMAQNEKTKMEKEIKMSMFQSKGLHQPKQQQKIEKMKSWFNQKIKLQKDDYQLFVDN
eukprot:278200_1